MADDPVDRGSRRRPPTDDDARCRTEQPAEPRSARQRAERVDSPPQHSSSHTLRPPQQALDEPDSAAGDDDATLTADELAAHTLADAELRSDLPTDIDAANWTVHDVAEWYAQQSLHPDVSSPTSDLPSDLNPMACSEHDVAEWQAQQSLPADEAEDAIPDDGTYRGPERATRHFRIRVIVGADWPSIPKMRPASAGKRLRSSFGPAIAGFEIQNRLTGHIGTFFFGGYGPGVGGAISRGGAGAWKDFSTKDPIRLRTFQGVVRLAELTAECRCCRRRRRGSRLRRSRSRTRHSKS